jgi:hypothetical protein
MPSLLENLCNVARPNGDDQQTRVLDRSWQIGFDGYAELSFQCAQFARIAVVHDEGTAVA